MLSLLFNFFNWNILTTSFRQIYQLVPYEVGSILTKAPFHLDDIFVDRCSRARSLILGVPIKFSGFVFFFDP